MNKSDQIDDDMLQIIAESTFHYTCPVCKAHSKSDYETYKRRGRRCQECHANDLVNAYPYTTFKEVYEAILKGKVITYKIAEGFCIKGQLVQIGLGQAKKEFPAITNESGQVIEFGKKAVMQSIKRTYPHDWKEIK
jgi:hypothetical protein